MFMMNDNDQVKSSDRAEAAVAITRWEGEGGAQAHRFEPSLQFGALTGTERRILECLGASVVKAWNELPTTIQRALFSKAAANTEDDPAQLKALIARFLHDHKDARASSAAKA